MSVDVSALGSIARSLEELVERLRDVSRDVDEEDEVGSELREIERQLDMSSRRLQKTTRRAIS